MRITRKDEGVTFMTRTRVGVPSWSRLTLVELNSACSSKHRRLAQAVVVVGHARVRAVLGAGASGSRLLISRIRSGSGTGSGRSSTWWTTEKSAVLAPMQSASVGAAVRLKALSRASSRRPVRRSRESQSKTPLL